MATQPPAKPLPKLSTCLASSIITVRAASIDKCTGTLISQLFNIHSALLIYESEYFARALQKLFWEGTSKCVDLNECDPRVFGHLAAFLYRYDPAKMFESLGFTGLVEIYLLGERLQMPRLQALVLKRVAKRLDSEWDPRVVCWIVETCFQLLPQRVEGVDLRTLMLTYTAGRVDELRRCEVFRRMLTDHPGLAVEICCTPRDLAELKAEVCGHKVVKQKFTGEDASEFDGDAKIVKWAGA